MPAAPEKFRLGVNYWPSETAMDWLARYDPAIVRRDFTRIAAAGMDTVRIFLRWEDVQPDPTRIDAAALAAVVDTADAANDAAVELIVTLFTGHMSGVNWIPAWATGGNEGDDRFRVVSGGAVQPRRRVLRNWYADVDITGAQVLLADRVASALSGHPALWAWDLGNEVSVVDPVVLLARILRKIVEVLLLGRLVTHELQGPANDREMHPVVRLDKQHRRPHVVTCNERGTGEMRLRSDLEEIDNRGRKIDL